MCQSSEDESEIDIDEDSVTKNVSCTTKIADDQSVDILIETACEGDATDESENAFCGTKLTVKRAVMRGAPVDSSFNNPDSMLEKENAISDTPVQSKGGGANGLQAGPPI